MSTRNQFLLKGISSKGLSSSMLGDALQIWPLTVLLHAKTQIEYLSGYGETVNGYA